MSKPAQTSCPLTGERADRWTPTVAAALHGEVRSRIRGMLV